MDLVHLHLMDEYTLSSWWKQLKIQPFSLTSFKFVRWVLKIAFICTSEHLCDAQPDKPTLPSVLSFSFVKGDNVCLQFTVLGQA